MLDENKYVKDELLQQMEHNQMVKILEKKGDVSVLDKIYYLL